MSTMTGSDGGQKWLDAATLYYELGREVQAVALLVRSHQIVASQQICACGRLPLHTLPFFGPRCDVVGERWTRANEAMRRIVAQPPDPPPLSPAPLSPAPVSPDSPVSPDLRVSPASAVGRATVIHR
ncbi:MAG: hypothetical protein ACRDUA_03450 [Micromonosporaceae bacterium]